MSKCDASGRRLIALCGKGGVGKTAVTAMMAKVIIERGKTSKLLLIDADPASGLAGAVGVKVRRSMGQIREEIIKTAQSGRKEEISHLADKLDYMVLEALNEFDAFALLAMGRTETLGCFCPVNYLLRETIEKLSRSFDTILIDGEAGLEQINRQVMDSVETLIIVSDASMRGLQTAALINKMVQEEKVIQCRNLGLVFNRVQAGEELLRQSAQDIGIEVFGFIPLDDNVVHYDLVAKPIIDLPDSSPAIVAVRSIMEERELA